MIAVRVTVSHIPESLPGLPPRLATGLGPGGVGWGSRLLTGPLRQGRRRRCRSRAGRGCRGRGHISWWSWDRRARRLPARPGAGRQTSRAAVMNACRRVCGPTVLGIPARRATRRTTRAAPCRSSRCPSEPRKIGPPTRSPTARSIARAVRGASGTVTTLPPLRAMTSVRCPRSTPRFSMLAPVASETRSPLSASSEISACSPGGPSPAATSSSPSSLRSSPVACDS